MAKTKFEKGDKVKIISGRYQGQLAKIESILGNGAMVERNVPDSRRFCTVMFQHLELIEKHGEKAKA